MKFILFVQSECKKFIEDEKKKKEKDVEQNQENLNPSDNQNASLDINRYKVINKIGEGCFGSVYQVKDSKTNEFYAAKVAKFMIDEDKKNIQKLFLFSAKLILCHY